jgi:hypothetical protein
MAFLPHRIMSLTGSWAETMKSRILMATAAFLGCLYAFAEPDPPVQPSAGGERYRLRTDLNGDSTPDLVLSDPKQTFGTGGGNWNVYIANKSGGFDFAGRIGAQVGFIRAEVHNQTCRIWFWWRGGSQVGRIGYYALENGIVKEPESIEIHAGDGGNDLGRSLFRSVFPEGANLDLEVSRTIDGKVEWAKAAE